MENESKLLEICNYYRDNFNVPQSEIDEMLVELQENGVEVKGNSFYCDIYNEKLDASILLAGTMDKADTWVLKKIIKRLKQGDTVYSMLNGNQEKIIPMLQKYNCKIIKETDMITVLKFN